VRHSYFYAAFRIHEPFAVFLKFLTPSEQPRFAHVRVPSVFPIDPRLLSRRGESNRGRATLREPLASAEACERDALCMM